MRISGVIPVLQTPFHPDGSVDYESLRREVRFVCDCGAPAMAFPGFASEWWKLTEQEIFQSVELIVAARLPPVRVIANVTAQSTYAAIEQARRFVGLGADAVMCLPPFVLSPAVDAVLEHLRAVLESVRVPQIVQYAPSLTGTSFAPDQLVGLHQMHPHFCSVKVDFIPPGPTIGRLGRAFGEAPVTFLTGYAGLQLPDALVRDACGLMPGAGHLPEDLHVFRRLQSDFDAGLNDFERLLPLLNFEMQTVDVSIAVHKRLLRERNVFESDFVREPGVRLEAVEEHQMLRYFRQAVALAAGTD